jgi:hypothetical protein
VISPIPFNGVVEKSSIAVPVGSPVLLSSLQMIGFIFGKEVMAMLGEVVLQGVVLLVGRIGLELEKLGCNCLKLIRKSGLSFSLFAQVRGKVLRFLHESTIGRALPALLSHQVVYLLHKPPILKTKWSISSKTIRIKNNEDRSVITVKHGEMVDCC